ncbi:MAG: DUF4112 domain-containing protein [Pseudomonadota bacterium]|jgi:Domain of unknown function (DUF4112)|uniref:DUF4112 domain-containing protein n=1 Tax=Sphingobium yanoikuyae TaxID=13690 RepID=UPI00137840C4|nr:DUF4112 domain-containing protein [Sphingobium yanoikuyae]NBB40061.1 DUF4112 domain-containing protein [Sphingobium yanoikuyae]
MPVSAKQFDDLVRDMPGFGRDPVSVRRRIEMMEAVLEGLFVIPGTKRRVGMDSLIGLVPVVGDIATAAMGAWIVWEARNLGLSKWQLTRMAANVGVDTLVGAIPFAGDIFDFLYKSNTKNLRIIRKHLDRHHPSTVTIDG